VNKQVEIAGSKVLTAQWMVQYIPLEFFQERSGDVRGMGPCIAVEQRTPRDNIPLLLF